MAEESRNLFRMSGSVGDDEKREFLTLLRAGKDPASAARAINPDYTGTMFRSMTKESSKNYDPLFAAEYIRARAEGRKHAEPRPEPGQPRMTTLSGHLKAKYLTEEMLEEFLEEVATGTPLVQACEKLEPKTSLTQINRRAGADELFAEAFAKAKEVGYPAFKERLRMNIVQMAFNGDYRAARDLAIIHLDEFKQFASNKHEISGPSGEALRVLAEQALPELPAEIITQMISSLEGRQLGSGNE